MKNVWFPAAISISLLAALNTAQADPGAAPGEDIFPAPSDPTAPESHYTIVDPNKGPDSNANSDDPDAVPAAFTHPEKPLTPAQAEVIKQLREKKAENKNWLLRAYEKDLSAHSLKSGEANTPDFYTALSEDKDLAKAAGIPEEEQQTSDDLLVTDVQTGESDSHSAVDLRPDPAPDLSGLAKSTNSLTQSFATPLGSSMLTEFDTPYALPSPVQPLYVPIDNQDDDAVKVDAPVILDRGALDIPGETAAENDPNHSADDDLTLNLLPGETVAEARAHRDGALELPLSTDVQRLEKQNATALNIPGKPLKATTVVKAPVVYPSDTAEMVPDLHPVRATVDDPFDILR